MDNKGTPIGDLGKFGLIFHIAETARKKNKTTVSPGWVMTQR